MLDFSPPDDAVCNDCVNYDMATCECMLDGILENPLNVACISFEPDEFWEHEHGCGKYQGRAT